MKIYKMRFVISVIPCLFAIKKRRHQIVYSLLFHVSLIVYQISNLDWYPPFPKLKLHQLHHNAGGTIGAAEIVVYFLSEFHAHTP
jgi:hypothetical protein